MSQFQTLMRTAACNREGAKKELSATQAIWRKIETKHASVAADRAALERTREEARRAEIERRRAAAASVLSKAVKPTVVVKAAAPLKPLGAQPPAKMAQKAPLKKPKAIVPSTMTAPSPAVPREKKLVKKAPSAPPRMSFEQLMKLANQNRDEEQGGDVDEQHGADVEIVGERAQPRKQANIVHYLVPKSELNGNCPNGKRAKQMKIDPYLVPKVQSRDQIKPKQPVRTVAPVGAKVGPSKRPSETSNSTTKATLKRPLSTTKATLKRPLSPSRSSAGKTASAKLAPSLAQKSRLPPPPKSVPSVPVRAPSGFRAPPPKNRSATAKESVPSSSAQMMRRPLAPGSVAAARNRLTDPSPHLLSTDESEYDSEMDDFIDDDTPIDDPMARPDVYSAEIGKIFKYDKNKYKNESYDPGRLMETRYADVLKEEARSARVGLLEDIEEAKKEKLEEMRKMKKRKE